MQINIDGTDDFLTAISAKSVNKIVKIQITNLTYKKNEISDSFELLIHYDIWSKEHYSEVIVVYNDVCEFKLANTWNDFPNGHLYHSKLSGWEKMKYHVFDINSNGDFFDTISFYCNSFEVLN